MALSERTVFIPQQEDVTLQEYAQEMLLIWQTVKEIQEIEYNSPQRNATNFDLWKLSETTIPVTPENYPSLARHGLLVAIQTLDGVEWRPVHSHMRDFWKLGIEPSQIYGYRLLPSVAFQKRLFERLRRMYGEALEGERRSIQ